MKKFVLIAALMVSSSSAFAGQKELQVFNALIKGGAVTSGVAGHTQLIAEDLACQWENEDNFVTCYSMALIDIEVGEQTVIGLDGKDAKRVFKFMLNAGASALGGGRHSYINVQATIKCSQINKGISEESAAKRTRCEVVASEQATN